MITLIFEGDSLLIDEWESGVFLWHHSISGNQYKLTILSLYELELARYAH